MSGLPPRARWARLGHLHSTISENECFARLGSKITTVSHDPIVKSCHGTMKYIVPTCGVWNGSVQLGSCSKYLKYNAKTSIVTIHNLHYVPYFEV